MAGIIYTGAIKSLSSFILSQPLLFSLKPFLASADCHHQLKALFLGRNQCISVTVTIVVSWQLAQATPSAQAKGCSLTANLRFYTTPSTIQLQTTLYMLRCCKGAIVITCYCAKKGELEVYKPQAKPRCLYGGPP